LRKSKEGAASVYNYLFSPYGLFMELMEDDKAKAIAEAMRTLHVDKLAVELFCATLCLYKWRVEAAAEDLNICRGKLNILEQSMKQKLVLQ